MRSRTPPKPDSTLAETQPGKKGRPNEDGVDHAEVDRAELEMLLHRARTASDRDTALEYVQRAVDMLPEDPRVQASVQLHMFQKLNRDAFLAFMAETDKHYLISFRNSHPFSVPKAREAQEKFPPARRTDGERALGMMWWMILGLIPAGLGTIALIPFVLRRAAAALQRNDADERDRRMAWTAVYLTVGLGLLALFFTALLILHLLLVSG